jgi:hypothetical protein
MSLDPMLRPVTLDAVANAPARLTLADVHAGDTVEMGAVPPAVREALESFGVREGARLRCESARRYVVVRTADGCIPLDRGLAAAVPVTLVAAGERAADR